jgi:NADPH:quinone reductase-like Zn-dependent oxidoreductase
MAARRSGHRAVRLRVRSMPVLSSRRAAGVRQPAAAGFTHWGSFAELVVVDVADVNVVRLPHALDFDTAARLGCRFATAYRAVVHQGRPQPGSWVAVHGCGGVGLSAVMIAVADGAQVVAVDPNGVARDRAAALGDRRRSGSPLLDGVSGKTPNTYPTAGVRRGTATSKSTTPGATSPCAARDSITTSAQP